MTRPWHVELDAILQLTPRGEIAIPMRIISHAVQHLSIAGAPSGSDTRLTIVICPSVSRRFHLLCITTFHAGKSDVDSGPREDE